MRALHLTAVVLVVAALASGCWTANAQLPGTLRNDGVSTDSVGRLNIEKTNYYFLFGLINKPSDDFVATEIRQAVKSAGGDGVANLTYEAQFGCLDLIIYQLTIGCVSPRTYKVTGDIVKIKAPPLPGKSAGIEPADTGARVARKEQSY